MSRLMRAADWPARLSRSLEAGRNTPFAWGEHDCCLFVTDCIKAMTGEDLAEPFRGRYHTKLGAARALRRYCGGGMEAMAQEMARRWRIPEVLPAMAQRGDAVLIHLPDWAEGQTAMGVCNGMHAAILAESGFAFVPMTCALRAWRI